MHALITIILYYTMYYYIIVVCESENYEGYSWPETTLGSVATAPCPCSDILGEVAAVVTVKY